MKFGWGLCVGASPLHTNCPPSKGGRGVDINNKILLFLEAL